MAKDTEKNTTEVEQVASAPALDEAASGPLNPITLSVGDIENAVKVIDFACEQGSFKGWSVINEVMGIRNRLVGFLRQVTVPVATAEEGAAAAETAAEVPESPGEA